MTPYIIETIVIRTQLGTREEGSDDWSQVPLLTIRTVRRSAEGIAFETCWADAPNALNEEHWRKSTVEEIVAWAEFTVKAADAENYDATRVALMIEHCPSHGAVWRVGDTLHMTGGRYGERVTKGITEVLHVGDDVDERGRLGLAAAFASAEAGQAWLDSLGGGDAMAKAADLKAHGF